MNFLIGFSQFCWRSVFRRPPYFLSVFAAGWPVKLIKRQFWGTISGPVEFDVDAFDTEKRRVHLRGVENCFRPV